MTCLIKSIRDIYYSEQQILSHFYGTNFEKYLTSDQIINTLFPKFCNVNVTPGVLLKFNQKVEYHSYKWDFIVEFDFWRQAKEKIDLQDNLLDCSKGIRPAAYQGKIVGQWIYNFSGRAGGGKFGITSDVTVFNKGIGKDFTIGLYAGMDF